MPLTPNKTHIAFILKVKSPTKTIEYRHISLNNVNYNLISKLRVNRIKVVFPLLILENQSAFVHRRIIIINLLVAFVLVHYLNTKCRGRDNHMVIKYDMNKAYDWLE